MEEERPDEMEMAAEAFEEGEEKEEVEEVLIILYKLVINKNMFFITIVFIKGVLIELTWVLDHTILV